jgi:hypothetical protein
MRQVLRAATLCFLLLAAAFAFAAGDVVVLKGGELLELRKPPERQGGVVLLTRADGTLLSVRADDVDWKASAAARNAGRSSAKQEPAIASSPGTPAEAARAGREGPKARVKLTDADVGHLGEEESPSGEKKDAAAHPGGGRLEVIDYGQERSGSSLVVRGSLRNSGGTPAANAKMTVTAMDEKGETIASGEASISNGLVEPGGTVSFVATIPVGEKFVGSIRFAPQWLASAAPGPARSPVAAAPTPAPGRAAAAPSAAPSPVPTPYGQGSLYAAPAPPASTTPPADGKTGYIPGMSSPENQPKPPD